MDLSTTYLGFDLPNPLVPGAGPLADDLDSVRRLEDEGASMIVMHSLFEEQITREQLGTIHSMELHDEAFGEALSYFPEPSEFHLGPEQYLEHVRRIKEVVKVPVVASLNGATAGGWVAYARAIEQAGADALELNMFDLPTDPSIDSSVVEDRVVDGLTAVKRATSLPVAVKLAPYWSALPHLARRLVEAGAGALVLFNRFYQPDIDPEALEAEPRLRLSDPSELLLRLRWVGILRGQLDAGLAVTGGVHSATDVVKSIMAGADLVQMTSALLGCGPSYLGTILDGLRRWMEAHEYESIAQMKGSMSMQRCPDPQAFTRANYMRILQSWRQ